MNVNKISHSLLLPFAYSIIHALVDATTVTATFAALLRFNLPRETAVILVLTYDLAAFASQPFLGIISDRLGRMRWVAGIGIVLCICGALLLSVGPFIAAITAGIGNALFHLGGGVISMSVRPGKASGPGIFVGPGTLGLAFGIWYGRFSDSVPLLLLLMLAAGLIVPILVPHPENVSAKNYPIIKNSKAFEFNAASAAMGSLLLSIVLRSTVGHSAGYACAKTTEVLFGLAAAGCLGKMAGGLLSDKLGWINVSVTALVLAGPLIAFGGGNPIVIGIGCCFFQMTMPVSLVAASSIIPNKPAFAFGLNCLAFITGALPVFLGYLISFYSVPFFLLLTAAAVGSVYWGLRMIRHRIPTRF